MKHIVSSIFFLLLWASSHANANVVSVTDAIVIGQMTQRTGPPPSTVGQFTGAPTQAELQNYLDSLGNWFAAIPHPEDWSGIIEYPIENKSDSNLNFGGVNLSLSNDKKTVSWILTGFDDLNVFFVFKNALNADLIYATNTTGSATLSNGLSNWGVFTTPVPVPAPLWLLSSGLIALMSYSRRRRHQI